MPIDQTDQLDGTCYGRLHLGFLDLHGGMGRRFGGLGLAIKDIFTTFHAARSGQNSASGPDADRVMELLEVLRDGLGVPGGVRIEIEQAIPAHVGLGSGTQLALAIGTAYARLHGVEADAREIARIVGRGQRSGIGIGVFSEGGFVVDGGRGPRNRLPPVIARIPVPEQWRFVLVFDSSLCGRHGESEREVFDRIKPMPSSVADELCRESLMRVLPALAEKDCVEFGAGISRVQQLMGDYFSQYQAGRFASDSVQRAVELLHASGATGYGQSSWGPTGFAIFADPEAATGAMRAAYSRLHGQSSLDYVSCGATNDPARLRLSRAKGSRSVAR